MDGDDCPTFDLRDMAELIQVFCPCLRRLEFQGCKVAIIMSELLQDFASPPNAAPLQELKICNCFVDNLYISSLVSGVADLEGSLKFLILETDVNPECNKYDEDYFFVLPMDLQPLTKLQ